MASPRCLHRPFSMLTLAVFVLLCFQSSADTNIGNIDYKNVTVLMRLSDPFVSQEASKFPFLTPLSPSQVSGYCPDLVSRLAIDMGFNYTVYLVDTSNAAIDNIAANQFTFACGNLVITDQRYAVVDFTQPFMETASCVVIPVDPASGVELWGFLQPFTLALWGCILATVLCFGLLLWLLEVIWIKKEDRQEDLETIWDSLYWAVASILAYGWLEPKSIAAKSVWAAYYLFVLVVVASYTANLAAALATKNADDSAITSYSSLPGHTICAVPGGNTEAYIRRTLLQPTPQVTIQWTPLTSDCLDMIISGTADAMILGCPPAFYQLTSNESYCNLMTTGPSVYPNYYGMAIGKGHSDFLGKMNIQLLKYQQQGTLELLFGQYFEHDTCPLTIDERQQESQTTVAPQLSPGSFSGLYIVIFSIVGIAVVYRVVVQVMKCSRPKPKPDTETPDLLDISDPLAADGLIKPQGSSPNPTPEPDSQSITLLQYNEILRSLTALKGRIDTRFQQMEARLSENEQLMQELRTSGRRSKKDSPESPLNVLRTPGNPFIRRPSVHAE